MSTTRTSSGLRRRAVSLAAPLIAAALLLTGCGGSPGGSAAAADQVLTIGTINPPSGLNAFTATDIAALWALRFTLDPLLDQSEPLTFVPRLAESIDTTDNLTWTVKLRPDAKWSDGVPITADDVVFTFNTMANPAVTFKTSNNLAALAGVNVATGKLPAGTSTLPTVKKVDDTTVTFTTSAVADPNYIKEMIGTKVLILPQHALKDIAPGDLDKSPFAVNGPDVYSGAYKIAKFTKDTSIEYTANPTYYAGEPNIKNLVMKIMPAANLAGELSAGTITMNASGGIGNIPFTDMATVKNLPSVETSVNPSIGFQTMEMNTTKLADAKVRRAFAMAINRPQIVDQILKGNGEIIDGPYSSVSPFLDKSLATLPYDPAAAKALLEEAGYDFSTKIDFVIPTGNTVREQSADIIMENLKAIGVNIVGAKYDFPTALAMGQKGQFDLLLIGYTFTIDPDVSTLYGPKAAYNFTGWATDRNTELLAKGKATVGEDDRKVVYNELQAIWQQEMPILTLYSNYEVSAKSKALTVGGATPFWNGTLANLEKWKFGAE